MRRRTFGRVLLLVAIAMLGCEGVRSRMPFSVFTAKPTEFTEKDLREELLAFANRFSSLVSSAGDQIDLETSDPRIHRATLLWKMRLVPVVREAAVLSDPQEAYAAVAYGVVMMRHYLTEDPVGRSIFGPGQRIAVEVARNLEEDVYSIARNFLDGQQVAKFREDVREFTEGRAITGREFLVPEIQRTVKEVRETGRLRWIVDIPMSPFRALEGVSSGAAAMHAFNDTTLRFASIVESLPEQVRWHAELLLYDVEARASVREAVAALESFTESISTGIETASQLPGELSRTLEETRGPLADANQVLQTALDLVVPLRETAEQVHLAGASWERVVHREEGQTQRSDARAFDVRDYEAAARSIGDAANQLQILVEELKALTESPGLKATFRGVDASLAQAESSSRGVVDHAAWRGLQLMIVLFLLLFFYRVLAWWLGKHPG